MGEGPVNRTRSGNPAGFVQWGGVPSPVVKAGFEEHVRAATLSAGEYVLPAGAYDDQPPHAEDEVYVVVQGRATLDVEGHRFDAGPGSTYFVPAGAAHRFVDIVEDLRVMVIFSPPYTGRHRRQHGAAPHAESES